jgi:hypothetical protein
LNLRILHQANLSLNIEGGIKPFHNKQKLKQYMTTKPALQKILKGNLHTEDEYTHSHERMRIIKSQEQTNKTNKQQNNYMVGITTYLSLTLNVNGLKSPIKTH